MNENLLHILLTDDDKDDCMLFSETLEELPLNCTLTILHNGEELMQMLQKDSIELPHVLFLDLNMPRKNGFDCLLEIKSIEKLKNIPVIIYTTSYELGMANQLYQMGAHYYIRKPSDYPEIKKVLHKALTLISEKNNSQPTKETFLLTCKKK